MHALLNVPLFFLKIILPTDMPKLQALGKKCSDTDIPTWSYFQIIIFHKVQLFFHGWKPIKGSLANRADLDQTPHNVVSDLGLHCLLPGFSVKNRIKATMEELWYGFYHQQLPHSYVGLK